MPSLLYDIIERLHKVAPMKGSFSLTCAEGEEVCLTVRNGTGFSAQAEESITLDAQALFEGGSTADKQALDDLFRRAQKSFPKLD